MGITLPSDYVLRWRHDRVSSPCADNKAVSTCHTNDSPANVTDAPATEQGMTRFLGARPGQFATMIHPDRVLLCSRNRNVAMFLAAWFRAAELHVIVVTHWENMIALLQADAGQFGLLYCDIDGYGDLEDIAEDLLTLRQKNRTLPIVVESKGFARDDLSGERKLICDACLRSPTSYHNLSDAVEVAVSAANSRVTGRQDPWLLRQR